MLISGKGVRLYIHGAVGFRRCNIQFKELVIKRFIDASGIAGPQKVRVYLINMDSFSLLKYSAFEADLRLDLRFNGKKVKVNLSNAIITDVISQLKDSRKVFEETIEIESPNYEFSPKGVNYKTFVFR